MEPHEWKRGDIVYYRKSTHPTIHNWFVNATSEQDGTKYLTIHGMLLEDDESIARNGTIVLASDCILVKAKKEFKLPKIKMSKPAITTGIVLSVIALFAFWFMGNYNSLVKSHAQVEQSWGSVEIQYQRRLDLIDNLVASAKGAQKQEIEVFGKIAESRVRVANAQTTDEKVQATNDLETNIALLPRLQEAYPDLKSNAQVQSLMNQLTETEDGIATKRDEYNKTATNYNVGVQRFPKNIFANMFGFKKAELYKADKGAEKATKVQF